MVKKSPDAGNVTNFIGTILSLLSMCSSNMEKIVPLNFVDFLRAGDFFTKLGFFQKIELQGVKSKFEQSEPRKFMKSVLNL